MIERLQISNLRNLTQVNLQPAACNVIIGANGSGKSTLSYIIEGINYAKKNDINIINCSFGGAGWGSTSVSIVKSAIEAVPDIFFVNSIASRCKKNRINQHIQYYRSMVDQLIRPNFLVFSRFERRAESDAPRRWA